MTTQLTATLTDAQTLALADAIDARDEAANQAAALAEVRRCLLRWERLAAIPARLATPILQCSIDSTLTLSRRAYSRGDQRRGDELFAAACAETDRRKAVMAYTGRSLQAWRAMASRLRAALRTACELDVLSPEGLRHVEARLTDCDQRAALACDRRAAGYPATA